MRRRIPRYFICLALALAVPFLSGCATDRAAQESNQVLQAEMMRLEWELAARDEANQERLLSQSEEFRRYHGELLAQLERLEDRLSDGPDGDESTDGQLSCPPPDPGEKLVLGRLERIHVSGIDVGLKARVDTGANTSSLHARNITEFERDGERWVRFATIGDDDVGHEMEAPVERYIRVRQASSNDLDRRPIVRLPARLGRIEESVEFSLTDRDDMLYPVLLGRSFFMDLAVVDVSRKFVETKFAPKPASDTARE